MRGRLQWREEMRRVLADDGDEPFVMRRIRLIVVSLLVLLVAIGVTTRAISLLNREQVAAVVEEASPLTINLARILHQEGEVEYLRSVAGTQWRPIREVTTLQAGDRVRTGEGSQLNLELPGGSQVRMSGESEVEFQVMLAIDAAENSVVRSQLRQHRGRLYHRLAAVPRGRLQYTVVMPHLAVSAAGTAFVSTIDPEGSNSVQVIQDEVVVRANNEEVPLRQGSWMTVRPGGIASRGIVGEDLLEDSWIQRNRVWDEEGDYPLGILGDNTPPEIDLAEPREGAVVTDAIVLLVGQTEPGAALFLNGVRVGLSPEGGFEQRLELAMGENEILLEAEDSFGNRSSMRRVIRREEPATLEPANEQDPRESEVPVVAAPLLYLRLTDQEETLVRVNWEMRPSEPPQQWILTYGRQGSPVFPNEEETLWLERLDPGEFETYFTLPEGGVWFVRLCFLQDEACRYYSNQVRLTLTEQSPQPSTAVSGRVTEFIVEPRLQQLEIAASWKIEGQTSGIYLLAWSQSEENPSFCSPLSTVRGRRVSATGVKLPLADFAGGQWYFGVAPEVNGQCGEGIYTTLVVGE